MDYEVLMNGHVKIGESAPSFECSSTKGKISLENYKGKWLIFFSYPEDFTPVCTSEIIAFAMAYPYCQKINTEILGLSVDSLAAHFAWIEMIYQKTAIPILFPLIADANGEIARKYGMMTNSVSSSKAIRNVYILNPQQQIKAIFSYPMEVR